VVVSGALVQGLYRGLRTESEESFSSLYRYSLGSSSSIYTLFCSIGMLDLL